jgi:hypothetical protein
MRAAANRPGTHLIHTDGEKRDEVEQAVRRADETRQRGLGETEIGQECRLFVRR